MLRIAVPNKGSLSEPAVQMLKEAGYYVRRQNKQLHVVDHDMGVEIFFLRPRDIAVYVGRGMIQAGITGRDLLLDSTVEAVEVKALGFGASKFRFAAPAASITDISDLSGKRIATSFDVLVSKYLAQRNIDAEVVHLDGAVESSIRLGVADAIADVVETGSTLRAAGLKVFGETILESEAILITTDKHRSDTDLLRLMKRLNGVLLARNYVLVDYNAPIEKLSEAVTITPGIESPTVSELLDDNWRAVRAMVQRSQMNRVMDDLHTLGARGIIVTELVSCRM